MMTMTILVAEKFHDQLLDTLKSTESRIIVTTGVKQCVVAAHLHAPLTHYRVGCEWLPFVLAAMSSW
jgi:hypothetical protein